jgi:hypothetical protein
MADRGSGQGAQPVPGLRPVRGGPRRRRDSLAFTAHRSTRDSHLGSQPATRVKGPRMVVQTGDPAASRDRPKHRRNIAAAGFTRTKHAAARGETPLTESHGRPHRGTKHERRPRLTCTRVNARARAGADQPADRWRLRVRLRAGGRAAGGRTAGQRTAGQRVKVRGQQVRG